MSMNLHTYYMSWHTWREEPVDTPWDFWYLSKGQLPKGKDQSVELQDIQQIWQNQDVKAWEALQDSHVWDIKLAAFVEAPDEAHAKHQVQQLFPDAVWPPSSNISPFFLLTISFTIADLS
jgi:hypothetical protein